MKHRTLRLVNLLPILAMLLAAITLTGCEGGNDGTSAPATSQALPSIQPDISPHDSIIQTLKIRLFDEPDNDALLSALGDAYFGARQFKESISIYKKAIAINPGNYDALNDLGLAYFYTGNTEVALDSLERSTTANPDYKFAWLSKGFILTSTGRFDEAKAALHKAKELDPNGNIGIEADNFLRQIEEMKAKLVDVGGQ
ncbi:hypothetical protein MNBD_GAMMA26-1713 [hydrothermal vent metagenome]|uniref:Uncharacterized protein n=1 Tax=hydrothermal vent metagenome TaxID=652676 RepID=A0A3B1AQ13_9ZZZZ